VTQSVTQTSLPTTAVRTSLGFSKRMAFSIYRLLGGLQKGAVLPGMRCVD
jgi:hypothetical protein